jgi:cytochrome c-type biogenesis protein CcmE
MSRKQRHLTLIGGGVSMLAVAVALMLNALRDSIVFFNSPSDVIDKHVRRERACLADWSAFRSVIRACCRILFRECQRVVAEGALDSSGTFKAHSILASMTNLCAQRGCHALKSAGHQRDDYLRATGGHVGYRSKDND